jgi:hypothetical protein
VRDNRGEDAVTDAGVRAGELPDRFLCQQRELLQINEFPLLEHGEFLVRIPDIDDKVHEIYDLRFTMYDLTCER